MAYADAQKQYKANANSKLEARPLTNVTAVTTNVHIRFSIRATSFMHVSCSFFILPPDVCFVLC